MARLLLIRNKTRVDFCLTKYRNANISNRGMFSLHCRRFGIDLVARIFRVT